MNNNNKSVLCIIDMQGPGYPIGGWNKVVDAIKEQIVHAKQVKATIVVVEYVATNSPTDKAIIDCLGDYPYSLAHKDKYDGSREILDVLAANDVTFEDFWVCGCVTDCCIRATVAGLRAKLTPERINVITEACWNTPWNENLLAEPLRQNLIFKGSPPVELRKCRPSRPRKMPKKSWRYICNRIESGEEDNYGNDDRRGDAGVVW